jgi:RimJ/RimL family protein N-acetyltransferase
VTPGWGSRTARPAVMPYARQALELPDDIVTSRLRLRPFRDEGGDAEAMHAVLGDRVSMRFYPRRFDLGATRAWVARWVNAYERDGFGLYAIEDLGTGEVVGDCGPSVQTVDGEAFVELGWHVRRDRQGEGIATEAGAAWRDHLLGSGDVDRLISLIRPENVPSSRVARKLGFEAWRGTVRAGMAHVVWAVGDVSR